MLHCHIENHNLEGMALIMKEGEYKEMNPPPPHFPQCGSFHLSEEDFRVNNMLLILHTEYLTKKFILMEN